MKVPWRLLVATVALLQVALLPAASGAADCGALEQATPSFRSLTILTANKCLGEENDTTQLTKTVKNQAELIAGEQATQVTSLARSLEELAWSAGETFRDQAPESELASHLSIQMQRLRREIESGGELGSGLLNSEAWQFDIENPNLPATTEFDVRRFLEASCPPGAPADEACRTAYGASKQAVRYATLVQTLLGSPSNLGELLKTMQRRGKQWGAYFNQARSQYIWELLLNDRLTVDNDRPLNSKGQPTGFRRVPSRQYIFLHPSVAFEYIDDAADGEQFQEAVVAEILGVNKWRWKEDGSMGKAFGVSLVVSASDRVSADDVGWGLMFHVNHKYSLAVTDHDGQTGVLVTTDLAKLWARTSEGRKAEVIAGENRRD